MDQNPKQSKDRSVRRMDGLGSSAGSRKVGAPLDLRNTATSKAPSLKPAAPTPRPAQLPRPKPRPIETASQSVPAPIQDSHFDDPLHGLVDNGPEKTFQQQPILPPVTPRIQKKSSKRAFGRFLVILLILLFIISAGLFIYQSYFAVQ